MARWIWIFFFPFLNCVIYYEWYFVREIFVIVFFFNSKIKGAKLFIIQLLHFCAELCARELLAEFFFGGKKNWENINKKEDNKFWRQNIGVFVCLFWFVNQQMIQESSKQKRSQSCANYQPRKLTKAVTPIFLRFVFSCRRTAEARPALVFDSFLVTA